MKVLIPLSHAEQGGAAPEDAAAAIKTAISLPSENPPEVAAERAPPASEQLFEC